MMTVQESLCSGFSKETKYLPQQDSALVVVLCGEEKKEFCGTALSEWYKYKYKYKYSII